MAGVPHSDGQFFSDGQGYIYTDPTVPPVEPEYPFAELERVFDWPSSLKAQSIALDMMARSRSGGVTLTGMEQIVRTDAGVWRITLSNVALRTKEQIRAWRLLAGQVEGRTHAVIVPVCDRSYSVLTPSGDSPIIYPSLLRATTVQIGVADTTDLENRRQHFSISHPTMGHRLYRILSSIEVSAGLHEIKIWPPLREAVASHTDISFDDAKCTMRLERDDGMDLDLDLARFGSPSVTFLEYF